MEEKLKGVKRGENEGNLLNKTEGVKKHVHNIVERIFPGHQFTLLCSVVGNNYLRKYRKGE
jgi:hypothetical protein